MKNRKKIIIAVGLAFVALIVLFNILASGTGNLDSKTGEEIFAVFHGLHRQGNTIIMVAHNQELADLSQRIFYLKDGEIVREERKGRTT